MLDIFRTSVSRMPMTRGWIATSRGDAPVATQHLKHSLMRTPSSAHNMNRNSFIFPDSA